MSRNIVLAIACLLSLAIAAPVLAFNPQPDPPANHADHGR